jgi:hypothetical protein
MKRVGYLLTTLAVIMAIGGCQNWSSVTEPDGANSSLMSPFDIADVTVDSAYFWIYVVVPTGQSVNVHAVTSAWVESTVTWGNFAGAYAPGVVGSFMADGIGWRMADITSLVQAWMDGTMPNFGLLLEQGDSTRTTYYSSEEISITQRPRFEICYTVNGQQHCVTIQRDTWGHVYDSFIWEGYPHDNFGMAANLYTGILNDSHKQSLIQCILPVIEDGGTVGDLVWCDDGDGIQEDGEFGLDGITVQLKNCRDSIVVATDVTDTTGHYLFEEVMPGSYFLQFSLPEGLNFAPMDQGDNDCHDSDVYPRAGHTDCFTVEAGEIDLCLDAGIICIVPPDSGCTRSKGYWKNHTGFGPQDDEVTQYLPIWLGVPGDSSEAFGVTTAQIAFDILTQQVYGTPSNGITKLYAQLLAAKLNIASGASDDAVDEVIGDADDFLALYSWEDWSSLTREQKDTVLHWKDVLDSYNNGYIGPGHCGEELDFQTY